MEYKNPTFTESGAIDVEINHPSLGWIPFTASPDDPEPHGRQIFEDVKDEAAEYVAPEPAPIPIPGTVTRFQARAALLQSGLLQQADDAVAASDWLTQIAWQDAQHFNRSSPTLENIAQALQLTDEQVDDLFIAASQIEA